MVYVCVCGTDGDLDDPEFKAAWNELAYDTCVGLVQDAGYDPDTQAPYCRERFESGLWVVAGGVPPEGTPDDAPFPTCANSPAAGCGAG